MELQGRQKTLWADQLRCCFRNARQTEGGCYDDGAGRNCHINIIDTHLGGTCKAALVSVNVELFNRHIERGLMNDNPFLAGTRPHWDSGGDGGGGDGGGIEGGDAGEGGKGGTGPPGGAEGGDGGSKGGGTDGGGSSGGGSDGGGSAGGGSNGGGSAGGGSNGGGSAGGGSNGGGCAGGVDGGILGIAEQSGGLSSPTVTVPKSTSRHERPESLKD
eukprot:7379851-Prymnesium_polylepis.4